MVPYNELFDAFSARHFCSSSQRKLGSILILLTAQWIPASAGMTALLETAQLT
jgi:hypothetical protein